MPAIAVRPATEFEDVKTVLGPKRPDANVCWCLSYHLPSKENTALRGPARGRKVLQGTFVMWMPEKWQSPLGARW